jgi:hypothetical protein
MFLKTHIQRIDRLNTAKTGVIGYNHTHIGPNPNILFSLMFQEVRLTSGKPESAW